MALNKFLLCLVLFCLHLPWATLKAASIYGYGSGLPNLSVTAIATHADGDVWMGTFDGLVKFDGHRFIPIDLGELNDLPDQSVTALLHTKRGTYVATEGRVLFIDAVDGSIQSIRKSKSTEKNSPNALHGITALTRGEKDGIFASSNQGQIWYWQDRPQAQALVLDLLGTPPQSFSSIRHSGNEFWLGSNQGAYRLNYLSRKLSPITFNQAEIDDGRKFVSDVLEYPAGILWIGFWNDALVRLDLKQNTHRWYKPGASIAGALRSTSIYNIAEKNDQVYFATNRGLVYYQNQCDCIRAMNLPSWDAIDGSGVIVESIEAVNDGVWVGSLGEGAVRFGLNDAHFLNQVRADGVKNKLAHNIVRAISIDSRNRLWVGTYGGGVQWAESIERDAGASWTFSNVSWPETRIEAKYLWHINPQNDFRLLSTGDGLFEQRANQLPRKIDSSVVSARCSIVSKTGQTYVGTTTGLYRRENDLLKPLRLGEKSVVVWSCGEHNDELWFGTSNGLFRLDQTEKLIAHHTLSPDSEVSPVSIFTQKSNRTGETWLGSRIGLFKLRENNGVIGFELNRDLRQRRVRNIYSIEPDQQNRLWLGTSQGLIRYVESTGALHRFEQRDGLFGEQFNIGASANDGRNLYFGGSGGLVSFDPESIVVSELNARPKLTQVKIGKGHWQRTSRLQLPNHHEPIAIEFSVGDIARPDRVRYAFRIKQSENEKDQSIKTELEQQTSLILERLQPGTHVLELSASSLDSPNFLSVADILTINVASPWYRTWWGMLALLVYAVVTLFAFVRWRTMRFRLRKEELEAQVKTRTHELEIASKALQQSNEQLRHMALIDPLTELANRRRLFNQAEHWRSQNSTLGVMMIDLDRFKSINDYYGHAIGDKVLREFAQLLSVQMHFENDNSGLTVRYGGEEFLTVANGIDASALEAHCEALMHRVRQHRILLDSGASISITVSIGLSIGTSGESIEQLLREADAALYEAKSERDRYRWYRIDVGTKP